MSTRKLLKLPQSGVILDPSEIVTIGVANPKSGLYVVVLRSAAQGPQIPAGDYKALMDYLGDDVQELTVPREVEAKIIGEA
jgi:hypothetical protein